MKFNFKIWSREWINQLEYVYGGVNDNSNYDVKVSNYKIRKVMNET